MYCPGFPYAVAVGTALSGRPPHRTRRAGLPHRAPTSGNGVEALGMVSIVLEDPDAQPLGDEPVYVGDAHNTRVELDIAGERFAGLASTQAAFDPKGLRMRH